MSRAYNSLPVYAGDVSGACSALFELGGMVVIHDPSGCNSTYNTHDETRWYDHDSLIFITGLTERDAILGNDDRLVADVVSAANELHPRFIVLCNSPIPFITGTDFAALTRIIEGRTGIPCFYVSTNGMHDYTVGAGRALAAVAERFVEPAEAQEGAINILGTTPLDLGLAGSPDTLRAFAAEAGFPHATCWAMGSSLDDLSRSAQAQVNLVVSATGLEAAKVLQRRFGTPYVVGLPVGEFRPALASTLTKAVRTGSSSVSCVETRVAMAPVTASAILRDDSPVEQAARLTNAGDCSCVPGGDSDSGSWVVVGEPVASGSLACAIERELGHAVRVVSPVETTQGLLAPGDVAADGEDAIVSALAGSELVVADAFFRKVCPPSARFIELSHQALSGRNSWRTALDLAALPSVHALGLHLMPASVGITAIDGSLPFDVHQSYYNAETEAALCEARNIMSGKTKVDSYDSAAAMFFALDE